VSAVIRPDSEASNGYLHVISGVLLPGDRDLVETAISLAPEFSTFVDAIEAAGLTQALKGAGPLTVFAPTNAAFDALFLAGPSREALFADVPLLQRVLRHHVFAGQFLKTDAPVQAPITMLDGQAIRIAEGFASLVDGSGNQVSILSSPSERLSRNGIIHAVSSVMLPDLSLPDLSPAAD
jgi:transforming growth factor-beta-induced protein